MAHEQIGRGLARFEDGALLTGRGRFADDLPVAAGTLYAAILRSPHAHADIVSIDTSRAVTMPGVQGLVTGEDARRWTRPFTATIKLPIEHWCIATNRVRYMGEPVAVVVCRSAQRREADHDAGEERRRDLQTAIPSTDLGSPCQPRNAEPHRYGARAHRARDDAAGKSDPEGGQRVVTDTGA